MSDFVVPNKASTIIVARPQVNGGFEVLMTRRHPKLQFLGGYLVFPGGGMETQDYSPRMLSRCRGLSAVEAQERLGGAVAPDISLGHWVAAVRELFEEAGIHFFVTRDNGAVAEAVQKRLAERRNHLAEGRVDLAALLESEQLFCDLSCMTYLFQRITPERHEVRFDTRFYLAALPENQSPLTSTEEVEETLWLTPETALEQSNAGVHRMVPPTIIALRLLAEHQSWESVRTALARK
jgi:8-oxo-dGTP pyrophosphatase MutT (NUDIX family)